MAAIGHVDLVGDNFAIQQGFEWRPRFTFPTGYSLSGYAGVCQIRRGPGAANPTYATPAVTVAQDVNSLWYVEPLLTTAQTPSVPADPQAHYEIKLTSGGVSDLGFKGRIEIRPKVIA